MNDRPKSPEDRVLKIKNKITGYWDLYGYRNKNNYDKMQTTLIVQNVKKLVDQADAEGRKYVYLSELEDTDKKPDGQYSKPKPAYVAHVAEELDDSIPF
jgi:hypothetical protein